jgi:hypothetical protein
MGNDLASTFLPVAPPRVIENAYSDDQHARLLKLVRDKGPWEMILAPPLQVPGGGCRHDVGQPA